MSALDDAIVALNDASKRFDGAAQEDFDDLTRQFADAMRQFELARQKSEREPLTSRLDRASQLVAGAYCGDDAPPDPDKSSN